MKIKIAFKLTDMITISIIIFIKTLHFSFIPNLAKKSLCKQNVRKIQGSELTH